MLDPASHVSLTLIGHFWPHKYTNTQIQIQIQIQKQILNPASHMRLTLIGHFWPHSIHLVFCCDCRFYILMHSNLVHFRQTQTPIFLLSCYLVEIFSRKDDDIFCSPHTQPAWYARHTDRLGSS